MDYSNGKDFNKIKLPKTYEKLSYGIFKDNRGNERFLIVANNVRLLGSKRDAE